MNTRFTKMPVTIDAVRFDHLDGTQAIFDDGTGGEFEEAPQWLLDALKTPDDSQPGSLFVCKGELFVRTLEGPLTISPGDWLIRGIAGELYPCKPDIFDRTYMPADLMPPAEDFRDELARVLNRWSVEREGGDTPDFLLADYLIASLRALGEAIEGREKWYGRNKIGVGAMVMPAEGAIEGEEPLVLTAEAALPATVGELFGRVLVRLYGIVPLETWEKVATGEVLPPWVKPEIAEAIGQEAPLTLLADLLRGPTPIGRDGARVWVQFMDPADAEPLYKLLTAASSYTEYAPTVQDVEEPEPEEERPTIYPRPGANIHGLGPDTDGGPNPHYRPEGDDGVSYAEDHAFTIGTKPLPDQDDDQVGRDVPAD